MRDAVLPITPGTPWLAPLAGWSDLPFRLLCREHGAAVCCTEMISARGLLRERAENGRTGNERIGGGRATHDLLAGAPGDAPLVVQLFGEDSRCMGDAVRLLADGGWRYFDCNMGCAVPKVTRGGAGADLLREPERALRVAAAMLAAAGGAAVGFKLRLGWDDSRRTGPDIAHALADMGAAWLTMHPRTARQGFSGRADWNVLRELAADLRVPLIASGDLRLARDGVRCLRETGVDAVMYARGALSDPAIFSRHKALLAGGPDCAGAEADEDEPIALLRRIRRHAALARTFGSPRTALLKMRAAVPRYIRSLEGAKKLRQGIIACRDWDDFDALLERFF